MLGGEFDVLDRLGDDIAIAPKGLDLGVEVGVVGTGDVDFGDPVTELSATAQADVFV